jgi:hypothetical protein
MPRIVKTNPAHIEYILAASALDDSESGADTAAVVYEQLARLGIVVP